MAIADNITAKCTLALSTIRLNEIKVSLLKGYVCIPNIRMQLISLRGKNLGDDRT
jgi:hypothetical protein